jgi:hypothetical protein
MRRTKRYGWPYNQPVNVPFDINWDSPQSKGLVAWWPIFDSRGRTTDVLDEFKRIDLTQVNTPTWVADGRFGPVLLFDDVASEYLIDTSIAAVTAPPFTMTAWAYFDEADAGEFYTIASVGSTLGQGIHALLMHGDTDDIRAYSQDDGGAAFPFAEATKAITLNTWHHCAGVWAAANDRRAFIDGGNRGTNAVNIAATVETTEIGTWYVVGAAFFFLSGRVADVRMYNRALTDNEIWQIYAEPWELYQPGYRSGGWRLPAVAAAIINQIQFANLGADLFDGTLIQ